MGFRQAALILMLALVAPGARAGDIYRSVDASGRPVYSNLPTDSAVRTEGVVESATAQGAEQPADPATGIQPGTDDDGFAASASVKRQGLERDMRETDRRLHALDGEIANLGRIRMKNAAGSEATGGVKASAADATSDEERALITERDQLRKHASELRDSYAKLREEVVAKLGGTPDWWIEAH
jgi:hypothetical protein